MPRRGGKTLNDESTTSTPPPSPTTPLELSDIQRQIGELAELIDSKDQEIEELRGNIRSEKSTFSALNNKINQLELSVSANNSRRRGGEKKPLNDNDDDDDDDVEHIGGDEDREHFEDDLVEAEDDQMIAFDEDTFTLMMLHPVMSRDWFLAICAVSFQWLFLILILIDLNKASATPFNIPYAVRLEVTVGQYLGIFICVGVQTDVLSSVRLLAAMWGTKDWAAVIGEEGNGTKKLFFVRVILPNFMKFISGLLVLVANFVTIVATPNIVDLMKDVAALLVISEITEIFFSLASFGFLGEILEDHAKAAPETEIEDVFAKKSAGCRINARLIVFLLLVFSMMGAVTFFVLQQKSGSYFYKQYPYCNIQQVEIVKFGDKRCDGGSFNSVQCAFDGGDCVNFNLAYPNCATIDPWRIGDGTCDEIFNTIECNYDGADCCPYGDPNDLSLADFRLADQSQCDGGQYSTQKCQYDAGGCDFVQRQYPLCLLEELGNLFSKDDDPPILGNGICESSIYNIDDCGDEVGDCTVCNSLVADKTLTGDGICHGGMHNSLDCNSDAGDCETFNARYPRCYIDAVDKISEGPVLVAVPIIGDGICNSGIYNNPDCGYEDGDCLLCNELVENSTKIGDGVCDGQNYMSDACGLDGGDCYGCPYSRLEIGNGWCTREYNIKECGYDGGDCTTFNQKYPDCDVEFPTLLGNGYCNGGAYNSQKCGYDDGDCLDKKELAESNCNVDRPDLLGDGVCNGRAYNTVECNWDSGDCLVFNAEYPDCNVEFPELIANGWCSGGEYDVEECKWDGGDCVAPEYSPA